MLDDCAFSCPHCSADGGELHTPGCPGEQCLTCGKDQKHCSCCNKSNPASRERAGWQDSGPAVEACLALGWFARQVDDSWVSCDADTPGAVPDVTRLYAEATWDPINATFGADHY